jgi:energy-coupling factor transport system ATP-binding protein
LTSRAEPPSLISLRGVGVRHSTDARWIGDGLDLELRHGEMLVVLGPSGCGKSTLLLTMTGLIPASLDAEMRGSVRLAGHETSRVRAGQFAGTVGLVLQDPDAQVISETLLDEVCFGLENLLCPIAEMEDRALNALRRVGLAETRADALRPCSHLSGGARQRLAIACALALDTPVLVFDEPTANLDPAATAAFYESFASLKAANRSLVLVEHELDDAISIADRMVVLDEQGRLVHDGLPRDVIGRHGPDLATLGIKLPTVTEVALRLGLCDGNELPWPIDEAQLAAALALSPERARPALAAPEPKSARPDVRGAAIQVATASVSRGDRQVLHGIDLDVQGGEVLAIAGLNGAGKSTLIQAMASLVTLASGSVRIDGEALAALGPRSIARRIGYVFQNPEHQFLAATVCEEIAYGLRVQGRADKEIAGAVGLMLERFDLVRYADISPFRLSHGEKRRLSLATALVTEPAVLLLDEPTFGQDRAHGQEIMALLMDANARGATIVLVTHDLQMAADYADRLALLSAGRLLAIGRPDDLLLDGRLIESAGLRLPPLRRIALSLGQKWPEWQSVCRLGQIGRANA